MRRCPIKTCGCQIAGHLFVCPFHWKKIPAEIRELISEGFRQYRTEEISLAQFQELIDTVLAEFQGIPVESVRKEVAAAATKCRGCGQMLVLATGVNGLLIALEKDEAGDTVVIGAKVLSAVNKPPVYTRFKRHKCLAVAAAASETQKVLDGKPQK